MRAASDLKNKVLKFSRGSFREPERGDGFTRRTLSASTDSRHGTEPGPETVSSVSDLPFVAAWGGWPSRGIPELASPLSD